MPKQLRTLSVYRKLIERLPEFRLISPQLNEQLSKRMGFENLPSEGDSILPSIVGKSTEFNARGKEIIRKDLPMEPRSRMVNTSWKDWHGHEHHGVQFRDYQAYPRELIKPPEEFITIMNNKDSLVGASRIIKNNETEQDIVNLLNIFLELFPSFEIVRPDLQEPIQIKKINWKILPQGQYPFEQASQALENYLNNLSESDKATAIKRIKSITRHNPDFIAVGIGGFKDYVVFGFTDRNRYVFESPNTGNATYVFRNEWEPISHLSKYEILQSNLHEERLIHNSRWHRAINEVINRN